MVDLSSGVAEQEDMTRTPSAVLADNAADQAHDHDPTDERTNWVSYCTRGHCKIVRLTAMRRHPYASILCISVSFASCMWMLAPEKGLDDSAVWQFRRLACRVNASLSRSLVCTEWPGVAFILVISQCIGHLTRLEI